MVMSVARMRVGQGAAKQRRHPTRGWRLVRYAAFGCVWLAFLAVAALGFTQGWFYSPGQSATGEAADRPQSHVGTITQQIGDQQCLIAKFDNDTGRTIEDATHCEKNVVLDAKGVPIPMGTVHRLDSISKSFLGDNR